MHMLLRTRLPLAVVVASLGLLAAPGGAGARKVIAPPGNSSVSQYVEVVPGAGGSVPVGSKGGHSPVLSPSERRRLEAAGPSGKALAAFAQQTGVPPSKHTTRAGAHNSKPAKAHGPLLPGAALAARPVRSSGGTAGGLGWGLFAALGAILLAGLGFVLVRLRAA